MIFIIWLLGYILCVLLYVIWLKYICKDDIQTKRNILESTIIDVLVISSLSWATIGYVMFFVIVTTLIYIIMNLGSLLSYPIKKLIDYIL